MQTDMDMVMDMVTVTMMKTQKKKKFLQENIQLI